MFDLIQLIDHAILHNREAIYDKIWDDSAFCTQDGENILHVVGIPTWNKRILSLYLDYPVAACS